MEKSLENRILFTKLNPNREVKCISRKDHYVWGYVFLGGAKKFDKKFYLDYSA